MKTANLFFIEEAYRSLTEPVFDISGENFGFQIDRSQEFDTLSRLTQYLIENKIEEISRLDNFIIGYKTIQLQKEFDLLKIFKDRVINIELKSQNTGEKMLNQLKQNFGYLKTAFAEDKKEIYCFTFVGNEREQQLFYLKDDKLAEIDCELLVTLLSDEEVEKVDLDEKFQPSKFLTAPYNDPEKFVNDIYSLTNSQESIEKNIFDSLDQNEENFILVKGRAGTGKSLVALDLYKKLSDSKKILFVFGASMNDGQYLLRNNFKYNICSIKEFKEKNCSSYDVVIVDEGQRLYSKDIETLRFCKQVVIFFDTKQQISKEEQKYHTVKILREMKTQEYDLKEKVRTNPRLADFIKGFFDLKQYKSLPTDIVDVVHVGNREEAKKSIKYFETRNYDFYNLTPSLYGSDFNSNLNIGGLHKTTHEIISQECDNVIVLLDQNFGYGRETKNLSVRWNQDPYYPTIEMLLQNMTRARYKLAIIIEDNEELYRTILEGDITSAVEEK